jgi:hypothetical protein
MSILDPAVKLEGQAPEARVRAFLAVFGVGARTGPRLDC